LLSQITGVDFRSGWVLCSCRFAFATENICSCRFAFATENICSCRFAFAQSKASWGRPMSRLGQQDVGHEGVITGRDGFSLRSSIR